LCTRRKFFKLMGLAIVFFVSSGIYTTSECKATEVNSSTSGSVASDYQKDIPKLREVYKDYFPIGAAINPQQLDANDVHSGFLKYQYNVLVPGNFMKIDATEPTENNFKFDDADKLVAFAQANNMKLRGHTLVWHSQVPDWFFQDKNDKSKPASRELLMSRMQNHIKNVAGRYTGKIDSWDVVNEVISDKSGLRGDDEKSKWKSIIGDVDGDGFDSDYIELAFKYAHEADPKAKLIINDYGMEGSTRKSNDMYELVKRLLLKGVPVDGVGLQMHNSIYSPSANQIKECIEKFASLKSIKPSFTVQVTEMDLSIYNSDSEPKKDATNDVLLQQASQYKKIFDVFKEEAVKKNLSMVMLWGNSDDDTWLDNFPVKGRTNAPMLFDRNLQAKPAYWSIVDPSKVSMFRQTTKASNLTPIIGASADSQWMMVKPFEANTYVKGSTGATAQIKTSWDKNNLYVLANVKDTTVGNNDSIDIFVNESGTVKEKYTVKRNTNTDTIKVKSTTDGYEVQAKLPLVGVVPAEGSKIGFDVKINDDNGNGGISSSSVWNDYSNSQDNDITKYGYLEFSKAPKVSEAKYGTPSIDGNIDEIWNSATVINTDVAVQGTNAAKAKIRTLWDENYLYALFEVTDSKLDKSSKAAHEQDSIEAFIDENNGRSAAYDSDDAQYRVNYANEKSGGGSIDLTKFKSFAKTTGNGYLIEVAIPLKNKAQADKILGFDSQVNDATDGKRTGVNTWCDPTGQTWSTTANLGNLKLINK
jgi:endo-1,4-beta-xylanase